MSDFIELLQTYGLMAALLCLAVLPHYRPLMRRVAPRMPPNERMWLANRLSTLGVAAAPVTYLLVRPPSDPSAQPGLIVALGALIVTAVQITDSVTEPAAAYPPEKDAQP